MTDLIIDDRYATLAECLHDIRTRYATHDQIIELGGTKLICKKPEWEKPVLDHLEAILDDIGNCALDSWYGVRHAIFNGPYLQECPNTDGLHNALRGPAICLAAGPTAQRHMERVRELSDTHYIFAVDAMADACKQFGFVPQYTCMIERVRQNADMVKATGRNGSRLIAPPVVDPHAATAFGGKCLWWIGTGLLYNWLAPEHKQCYAGKSCGVLSVHAALMAGCNPIYLVGHDLAYDNGKSHADSVHPVAPVDHRGPPQTDSHVFYGRRTLAEASGGGTVETCGIWNQFRHDLEQLIAAYPRQAVINCGGLSKIAGAVPGELADRRLMVREPEYERHEIKDWSRHIPRIIENIHKVQDVCKAVDPNYADETANALVMSKIVDHDLAPMFNYIFRSIASNLKLRLRYRTTRQQFDALHEQRAAAHTMVATTRKLCDLMETELA